MEENTKITPEEDAMDLRDFSITEKTVFFRLFFMRTFNQSIDK